VQPISAFSAECLGDFWNREGLAGGRIVTNELPGEFGGSRRPDSAAARPASCVKILCVSTLEPRKNHLTLLRSCLRLQERFPELNWSLTLVGNKYAGFLDIAEQIQEIERRNPRIKWLGVVDDATLLRLYKEATFTVYPSLIEGFGLPVLESLWHGLPCICSGENAIGELAAAGGCLTVDVRDEEALSVTIHRLATDADLLSRLRHEAFDRRFRTWDEYARDFLAALSSASEPSTRVAAREPQAHTRITASPAWQDILYPGCLCENWQMNHSERLALTALLKRHRPACSIEIGTYQGGSLSLLAQESRMVFSIDIDPTIPAKFASYSNVSCLTGPSTTLLPLLFQELDEAGIDVDFILLDGDHSAEGIRRDLVAILSHPPTKLLFVAMHDSVNPECRRGMLEAPWRESPYVQWVDLDFVPGRMVEDGGHFQGELWGGLGLAYLAPTRRRDSLDIQRSADGMFELLVRGTQNAQKA
jgi:predicted O-methyltransferase YrrM